ncbi:MAG: hypothetical protein HY795_04620 [Desulfovibrio sp.]|nr:hypothetical protein [Desulfovibrio sp.]MBI4960453.1 hypothetical protein [Desulfovibrio sp.]
MFTIRFLPLLVALGLPSYCLAQTSALADRQAIYSAMSSSTQTSSVSTVDSLKSLVPQYGNWCGFQTTSSNAAPIDCLDAACMEHDLSPGYSTSNPTLAQVVQADRQFIGNLTFSQASTPSGELYRNMAIQIFEAKTTYEQANSTTLVTPCKDCLSQP